MRTRTRKGPSRCNDGHITVRRLVTGHGVTAGQLRRAVRAALAGKQCRSLTVVIVDDRQIARLHEQFMADPNPTDVLAFDLRDDTTAGFIEGEIVLSAETAWRQARVFHAEPPEELIRYAIHGTLHLTGYDDHTPAGRRRMRQEENRILSELAAGNADRGRPREKTGRPRKNRRRTASRAHR